MANRFAPTIRSRPRATRNASGPTFWVPAFNLHPDTGQPYRVLRCTLAIRIHFKDNSVLTLNRAYVTDREARAIATAKADMRYLASHNATCPVVDIFALVTKTVPLAGDVSARLPLATGAPIRQLSPLDTAHVVAQKLRDRKLARAKARRMKP